MFAELGNGISTFPVSWGRRRTRQKKFGRRKKRVYECKYFALVEVGLKVDRSARLCVCVCVLHSDGGSPRGILMEDTACMVYNLEVNFKYHHKCSIGE